MATTSPYCETWEAARRRFNIVPFLHKPAEPDRDLEAEWPAILAWMIEGCLAWQRYGLKAPETVKEATADYFDAQDVFGQWATDRCIMAPHLETPPSKLLLDFNAWASVNGEEEVNRNRLRAWAERQPALRYKIVKGTRFVAGVGLRPPQGGDGRRG